MPPLSAEPLVKIFGIDLGARVIDIRAHGAQCNAREFDDGVTDGTTALGSPGAVFTPADVGREVVIVGGASWNSFGATVVGFVSTSIVTLSAAVPFAHEDLTIRIGTNDTAAITAAWSVAEPIGASLWVPKGATLVDSITSFTRARLRGPGHEGASWWWTGKGDYHLLACTEVLTLDGIHFSDSGFLTRADLAGLRSAQRGSMAHCYSDSLKRVNVHDCRFTLCVWGVNLRSPSLIATDKDASRPAPSITITRNSFTWSKPFSSTVNEYTDGVINIDGFPSASIRHNIIEGISARGGIRVWQAYLAGDVEPADIGMVDVSHNTLRLSTRSTPTGADYECTGIYCRGSHFRVCSNRMWEWGGRCIDIQGPDNQSQLSRVNEVRHNRIAYRDTGSVLDTVALYNPEAVGIHISALIQLRHADAEVSNNSIIGGSQTLSRVPGIVTKCGNRLLTIKHNYIRTSGDCIELSGTQFPSPNNSTDECANVVIEHNRLDCYRGSTAACIYLNPGYTALSTGLRNIFIHHNYLKGTGVGIRAGVATLVAPSNARIRELRILRNTITNSTPFEWNSIPYFSEVDFIGSPTFEVNSTSTGTDGDGNAGVADTDHHTATLQDMLDRLPNRCDDAVTVRLAGSTAYAGAVKVLNWSAPLTIVRTLSETLNSALKITQQGTAQFLLGTTAANGLAFSGMAASGGNNYALWLVQGRFEVAFANIAAYRTWVRADKGARVSIKTTSGSGTPLGWWAVEAADAQVHVKTISGTSGHASAGRFHAIDGSRLTWNGSTLTAGGGDTAENGSTITGA